MLEVFRHIYCQTFSAGNQDWKPLRGKNIYLQTSQNCDSIIVNIKCLGGTISEFLTKRIDFVVVDSADKVPQRKEHLLVNRDGSRAPTMLKTALSLPNYQKKFVQEKALQFGFQVYSVSEFQKMINEMIESKRKDYIPGENQEHPLEDLSKDEGELAHTSCVQGLKAPLIKVEDRAQRYTPMFKEFDSWPKISFDSLNMWEGGNSSLPTKPGDQRETVKFCDCCGCHFTDLRIHLESVEYMSFAKDDINYEAVDKLIARGPSMNEFVTNALKRHGYLDKQMEHKEPV